MEGWGTSQTHPGPPDSTNLWFQLLSQLNKFSEARVSHLWLIHWWRGASCADLICAICNGRHKGAYCEVAWAARQLGWPERPAASLAQLAWQPLGPVGELRAAAITCSSGEGLPSFWVPNISKTFWVTSNISMTFWTIRVDKLSSE